MNYVNVLPRRMGAAISALFARDGYARHARKLAVVHELQHEGDNLPLTADDAALFRAAEQAQRACYADVSRLVTVDSIMASIAQRCEAANVPFPAGELPQEIIARAVDRNWWIRMLRKEHARRFEHVAIRLGFTGLRAGVYLSHESASRQARRNAQNQKLLESTTLVNENGQEYTLAELAALGMADKAKRRGELMTRIRGFEEIAFDMGHVGMFATITAPSKFHSVGGENANYQDFTPREAQSYLVGVWARIRASLHRRRIRVYGFRIAEPHSDGCPHWHLLLFVQAENLVDLETVITAHALAEDGEEKGAKENRCKLIRIEAGKGTAAGYIAKYIAKNIDGEGVGDHKTRDGYTIVPDLFGSETFTPSQRVTYWSQLHGIRQFQQIGGAPIGVWREIRRIKAEAVAKAPAEIKAAWHAVQSIKSTDAAVAKRADFAAYVRAQGGVFVGRNTAVRIAKSAVLVEGRYLTREELKPCGVYAVRKPEAVYESTRYTWTVKQGGGVAVAVPWTRVNNCTVSLRDLGQKMHRAAKKTPVTREVRVPVLIDWAGIKRKARDIERKTNDFARGD